MYDHAKGCFIVDPMAYDKRKAFELAKAHVLSFLSKNGLPVPRDIVDDPNVKNYGSYSMRNETIRVNVKSTRMPVKTPGFSWSFTGYKADLTAPGVLAHEAGHFVHHVLLKQERFDSQKLIKIIKTEPRVTSYEPTIAETFAEMMKVFVLDPALLKEGRPMRHAFFANELGLVEPHDAGWREVLEFAHPKLIEAAERWIGVGST